MLDIAQFYEILTPAGFASLFALTMLEIVLGIDNVIFIALAVERMPPARANFVRRLGLGLALFMRIAMLLGIAWILGLTEPVFELLDKAFSWKDLFMLAGGGFLIINSTLEMHEEVMVREHTRGAKQLKDNFMMAIAQIAMIDLVFSFDSILTAVGMTKNIAIIIVAMTIAMVVMLIASGWVARFLHSNPTFKMLGLSFILMIGVLLVAEGFGQHIERGYIYAALLFSAFIEALNTFKRRNEMRRVGQDPLPKLEEE